jgi:hypothetical protein
MPILLASPLRELRPHAAACRSLPQLAAACRSLPQLAAACRGAARGQRAASATCSRLTRTMARESASSTQRQSSAPTMMPSGDSGGASNGRAPGPYPISSMIAAMAPVLKRNWPSRSVGSTPATRIPIACARLNRRMHSGQSSYVKANSSSPSRARSATNRDARSSSVNTGMYSRCRAVPGSARPRSRFFATRLQSLQSSGASATNHGGRANTNSTVEPHDVTRKSAFMIGTKSSCEQNFRGGSVRA